MNIQALTPADMSASALELRIKDINDKLAHHPKDAGFYRIQVSGRLSVQDTSDIVTIYQNAGWANAYFLSNSENLYTFVLERN